MARITQQSSIGTTGVSYENEPIIRSDAVGEIMQWQPSDGGADGIYITESVEDGPAFLGIGIATPVKPLHVTGSGLIQGKAQFELTGSIDPTASTNVVGVGTLFTTEVSVGDEFIVAAETRTVASIVNPVLLTVSAAFSDNANDTTPECKPAALSVLQSNRLRGFEVGMAGAVAIPGTVTVGKTLADGGAAGTPAYSFGHTTATGMYSPGANQIRFSTASTDRLTISSAGVVSIPGTVTIGSLDIGHGAGTGGTADTDSTAVGKDALDGSLHTSTHNTAIGSGALSGTMTADADYNTAVGYASLGGLTSGDRNTALGVDAGDAIAAGHRNTTVGQASLSGVAVDDNTAVGHAALNAFTGSNATAVGSQAAVVAGSQTGLTAIGKSALGAATSGNDNTAVGYNCLDETIDGTNNTAVGAAALSADCVSDNTAVGRYALLNFIGSNATAVGSGALDACTTVTANLTAIGKDALGVLNHADAENNTAIGAYSLDGLTGSASDGHSNTAVGAYSLSTTDDGMRNTALGKSALHAGNCANDNTGIGYNALYNFTGSNATVVGSGAADAATSAGYLTAVGGHALSSLTTGGDNTAVGFYSSLKNTIGYYNTTVGVSAGQENDGGDQNTFVGRYAGAYASINDHCVAIGSSALAGVAGTAVLSCVKNGTTTITCPSSSVIATSQHVRGDGIPADSTVTAVNVAGAVTSFTITPGAATDSATSTLTFYTNVGDYNIGIG